MQRNTVPVPGAKTETEEFFGDVFKLNRSTVPVGEYLAYVIAIEKGYFGQNETPCCDINFAIKDDPNEGKIVRRRLWGTKNAAKITRSELAKLGITESSQLEQPIPKGIVARITVVQGDKFTNDETMVSRWEVVDVDPEASESTTSTDNATPLTPAPLADFFGEQPTALLSESDFAAMKAIIGEDC